MHGSKLTTVVLEDACLWAGGLTVVWGRWSLPTLRGVCGAYPCTVPSPKNLDFAHSSTVHQFWCNFMSFRFTKVYSTHLHYKTHIYQIYCIARNFGGELNLAVLGETAKLKSAKIYTACTYIWRYCSRPPNLNQRIHSLGTNRQI